MINIKLTGPTKQFSLWLKIVIGILISVVGVGIVIGVYLFIAMFGGEYLVRQEVLRVQGMKITSFAVGEIEFLISVDVTNKGPVTFRYFDTEGGSGFQGRISIESIGPYNTEFHCVDVRQSDGLINSEGGGTLSFGRSSYFTKWFPFDIKNPQDIADNYDNIINVLKTLPTNPAMKALTEQADQKDWHSPKVVKIFNPDYVSHVTRSGFDIFCDLSIPPKQQNQKRYISKSPEQSELIDYGCTDNEELFQDSNGCGCQNKH